MRVAPEALARRLKAGLLALCCLAAACGSPAPDITVAWSIDPTPPMVSKTTTVRITLADSRGAPVRGAKLRLDAHMTHPGMAPLTSDVSETGDGAYQSRVRLSMAGEWVFVVTGGLPDGRRLTEQMQVPAVRPAETPPSGR